MNSTATEFSNVGPPFAFTGEQIIRQLEKRTGPLSLEELHEIGLKTLETLQNATRARRIAFYGNLRRALKKSRRTGEAVEVPEL